MGPRFVDRGNRRQRMKKTTKTQASMGPRFVDRGNLVPSTR